MICGICKTVESKYKCPNCLLSYCSLNCWKEHKKIKCEYASLPEKTEVTNIGSQEYKHQTEDTVPLDKLKLLGMHDRNLHVMQLKTVGIANSKVLQRILQNPHLQELLVSVDRSSNPDRDIQLAMQEPMFVEFADECLKVIEPMEDVPTVSM